MTKGRMEAFTDGVIAIVITIMVLELKVPARPDMASLIAETPVFLAYALSYANVGLFWNNHHHMLHASEHVDGRVLWLNLFLLFWISLIPFVVRWIDDSHIAALPAAAYGAVLFMAAVAYYVLERGLMACNGENSALAKAVGSEWKGTLSMALYAIGAIAAFIRPWLAIAVYVGVALMWFAPDRRIESRLKA